MEHVEHPKVLVSEKKIEDRIKELGQQLAKDYKGKNLTIICVLKGCIPFVADLIRNIPIPFKIDVIHASSYINKESSGTVKILSQEILDIKDRDVLIVDDILDTGRTMLKIKQAFEKYQPKVIKTCVLLDKPSRRTENVKADYIGFEIPNAFVVGYGLDYNEYYRNLPYIGTLESD
ncbi:MAG TPA: hypoxanthine phosphoribosyltransferase [Victivallales bacterium]|nr:hypoxanthine phosphoribosyltransferase [Victivallales bacterium]